MEEDGDTIEEILEDDFSIFTDTIQNAGLFTVAGRENKAKAEDCIRWQVLAAAKKAGYDCVLIEDFTDGDDHETYIALNSEIIKKVTDA